MTVIDGTMMESHNIRCKVQETVACYFVTRLAEPKQLICAYLRQPLTF